MYAQPWGNVLLMSLQNLWIGVISFVPALILAIVIFLIGWLIASLIGKAVAHLISLLKLDSLLARTGVDATLSRAGFRLNSGAFIGGLVKWFIILVFLVASLDILGLTEVTLFLRQVVLVYLPNVIVAAFILLAGSVLADLANKVVRGGAAAANAKDSNFLGSVSKWAIWIFTILIALSQLGIASQLIQILFIGVVAMMAIAGGLAFGLGGKEHASRALDRVGSMIRK
jgi:hypothetical protein